MRQPPRQLHVTLGLFLAAIIVLCLLGLSGCTDKVIPATPVSPVDASVHHNEKQSVRAKPDASVEGSPVVPAESELPDLRGVSFVDVAYERGLRHICSTRPRPMRSVDAFGSGCATFDVDNDGWQDVLLVDEPFPALFRNIDGSRFENITSASGLTGRRGALARLRDWRL